MKILLANKFFYLNGGSETVFFQEREFLINSGIQVVDFSMQHKKNMYSPFSSFFVRQQSYNNEQEGFQSKVSSALSLVHSREAMDQIRKLIASEKPDILHCHNIYHQLTPSILRAAKEMGLKVVITLHDYKVVCPVYTRLRHGTPCSECLTGVFHHVITHRCSDSSLAKSLLLYVEAATHKLMKSYEAVDKFIVPSQFMAGAIRNRFSEDRISLLYNGVDCTSTPFDESDDGYLLFLGRLSPEKGIVTLGKAQAGTSIRVIVAGTGPMEGILRQQFPSLEFVGHQSGNGLKKLIQNAAAIVVPSEWYENCPMSILEGMSFGKPIIGCNIGGIPELISDGTTGLLFEPGNVEQLRKCMAWMLEDQKRRRILGQAAFKQVETKFSRETHNKKLISIYRSLF